MPLELIAHSGAGLQAAIAHLQEGRTIRRQSGGKGVFFHDLNRSRDGSSLVRAVQVFLEGDHRASNVSRATLGGYTNTVPYRPLGQFSLGFFPSKFAVCSV